MRHARPIRAHQELLSRAIRWDRIGSRLLDFPAIAAAFPLSLLKSKSKTVPYYSHYMTTRLSEWPDVFPSSGTPIFARLNELLSTATHIEGWTNERSLRMNQDYGAFWSLLWQLQVMEWLLHLGVTKVIWNGTGPDLTAAFGNEIVHIECTVRCGDYPQREYLECLLELIDPTLRLGRARLPDDASALDQRFESIVQDVSSWLPTAHESDRTDILGTPIIELCRDEYSVRKLPNEGPRPMFPDEPFFVRSDPTLPRRVIEAVVSNKAGKNRMLAPGPKVLAINCLLSRSYQRALVGDYLALQALNNVEIGEHDGVLSAVCGIDRPLWRGGGILLRVTDRVPAAIRECFQRSQA